MDKHGDTAAEPKAVQEARARLDALRKRSNRLPADQDALGRVHEEMIEQEHRLEREGEEALRRIACTREVECRARLPPDQQELETVMSVRDWPTHRRTGRGLIVVRALDRKAAIESMKPANKVGAEGVSLYDCSPEAVLKGLMSAALWPDPGEIQEICNESPAFALAAYGTAVNLAGAFAKVTSGKSES